MADGGELIEAVLMAIIGTSLSVFMIRFGGEVLDRIVTGFMNAGLYEISSTWQTGAQESLINVFYIIAMLPCILGIVAGYLRTQRTTEIDVGQYVTEGDYLQ